MTLLPRMNAIAPSASMVLAVTPRASASDANDVRVSKAQADAVVEAVRGNGVEVDYLLNEQREDRWLINQTATSNFTRPSRGSLPVTLGTHHAE